MAGHEERLKQLGIVLPGVQPAVGSYLSAKRDGALVFVSGHGPIQVGDDGLLPGKTSRDISVQDALSALIQGRSARTLRSTKRARPRG